MTKYAYQYLYDRLMYDPIEIDTISHKLTSVSKQANKQI